MSKTAHMQMVNHTTLEHIKSQQSTIAASGAAGTKFSRLMEEKRRAGSRNPFMECVLEYPSEYNAFRKEQAKQK